MIGVEYRITEAKADYFQNREVTHHCQIPLEISEEGSMRKDMTNR